MKSQYEENLARYLANTNEANGLYQELINMRETLTQNWIMIIVGQIATVPAYLKLFKEIFKDSTKKLLKILYSY